MAYFLKNIILGEGDAKRELITLKKSSKNFEDYYYDHNNISEKVMDPLIYLILGKKGTGKTLLAEYLKKKASYDPLFFVKMESYKKFSLTELQALRNGQVTTEEYIPIWKWIILIELAKLCLKNVKLGNKNEYFLLKNFLEENGFNQNLDSFKTISITKDKKLGLTWKFFTANSDKIEVQEKADYLELIGPLEELIINLLRNGDGTYNIIFDELDDKFDGSESYTNSIICLLKVAEDLNFNFFDENINFKIMIFLRNDILKELCYADLNKMIEGSSIILNWGAKDEADSPLLKLLTKRIKESIPELKDKSHLDILNLFFGAKSMNISKSQRVAPYKYLLTRTLYRPRDIISFVKKIIDKYGDETLITKDMILNVESSYSAYLAQEIRDELVGHLTRDEINKFFLLLRNYGHTEFTYSEVKAYMEENIKTYDKLDLEKIINKFYLAGALGGKRFNPNTKKYHFNWYFKEESVINLQDTICIQNGIRKFLNLR
ncbi:P-loop ATPase, Sll1717 family [Fusobacterium sp. SYSU M8A802]